MLTEALVSSTETVKALPEDVRTKVVAEIVALGKNAEDALVSAKKKEWAQRDEEDIFKLTGIEKATKEDGKPEAYYDYRNRVISTFKAKAESAADTKELDTLKKDLDAAKAALKNNTGDATLRAEVEQAKQALADKEAQISAFKNQLKQVEENARKMVEAEKGNLNRFRTEMEYEKAKNQFKFQDEAIIPKEVRETYAKAAFEKVLATKQHEWRKGADGTESLVFLEPNGTIAYNQEKGLAPFTLADYLAKELDPILDKGHQQSGAGTKPGGSNGGGGTIMVDLGFAKTKAQVNEIIRAELAKQGIAAGDPQYQTKYEQAKATVKNYAQLPMK